MPWSYEYNPTMGVIEVAYRGSTSARDLQESTSRFIDIEHEQGINRFLVDTSDMELDATLLDVHDLPEAQYVVEGAGNRTPGVGAQVSCEQSETRRQTRQAARRAVLMEAGRQNGL